MKGILNIVIIENIKTNEYGAIISDANAVFNSNPDEYSTPYLASLTAKVGDIEIVGDTEKVYIEFNVLNTRGVSLPSTGGVGTIIFTVSGITIMSISLLMIVKRRKQN